MGGSNPDSDATKDEYRTPRQRFRAFLVKLTQTKLWPVLFTGEAVKSSAYHVIAGQPPLDIVGASWLMSALATLMWTYTTDELGEAVEAFAE